MFHLKHNWKLFCKTCHIFHVNGTAFLKQDFHSVIIFRHDIVFGWAILWIYSKIFISFSLLLNLHLLLIYILIKQSLICTYISTISLHLIINLIKIPIPCLRFAKDLTILLPTFCSDKFCINQWNVYLQIYGVIYYYEKTWISQKSVKQKKEYSVFRSL